MEALFLQPPHTEHLALCSPPSFHVAFLHLGKERVFSLEILCAGIKKIDLLPLSLLQLVPSILFLLSCLTLLSDSLRTLWLLSCK